jgi:hypothetical protein
VRVHLAGEHALELQRLDLVRQLVDVGLDRADGALVVLGRRQFEQLARFRQRAVDPAEFGDNAVQVRALAPKLLRPLGIVPDPGVLEFPAYFLEALALGIEVKDTP